MTYKRNYICRASKSYSSLICQESVVHHHFNILVTEQFLQGMDVPTTQQQMDRERLLKIMPLRVLAIMPHEHQSLINNTRRPLSHYLLLTLYNPTAFQKSREKCPDIQIFFGITTYVKLPISYDALVLRDADPNLLQEFFLHTWWENLETVLGPSRNTHKKL